MSEECRNDCTTPLLFPKRILNRPGLSWIDYRIGAYADFREALLRALNQDPVLANWTHREADDPGIALLEGASILGDILTFYQELYANEAFLRTAQWRESVSDLVRMLGYRLSPGIGGKATFAFEVKGDKPVVVPKGFPISAKVEGVEKSVEFETLRETILYPALSKFHLYRPRRSNRIKEGVNRLEVDSIFIKDDEGQERATKEIASVQSLSLSPGDRLILVPDSSMFEKYGPCSINQAPAEILIVSKVYQVLDRTIIELQGRLTMERSEVVTAYRIGRSFRHFGYNAPAITTKYSSSQEPNIIQEDTDFLRNIDKQHSPTGIDKKYYSSLSPREIPLDIEVNDLSAGNELICQGFTGIFRFIVVREIRSIRIDSLKWGNLTGPSTVVRLKTKIIANEDVASSIWMRSYDIRQLQFHEIKSCKMSLKAPTRWFSDPITKNTKFNYWGTYEEASSIYSRQLILQKPDETSQKVIAKTIPEDVLKEFKEKDQSYKKLWLVSLVPEGASLPEYFNLEDFDEETPKVTVYGNLVEATQGKTQRKAVLGNGDNREAFQTFKLPKSPLTYFRSEEETPPEVPELEVYVNDRLWKRVPSLFGRGPKEEIYIAREDGEGESWVQFGDGKTGARLPTGYQNVVAVYRTGIGAYGPLKEGASAQAGGQLDRLKKIHLPGLVTGGDEPETAENAREAAPGKVQGLGRLVSLKDFEREALAIAGVSKAAARWSLKDNSAAVVVTVLMESGREKETSEVQAILCKADRDRGAQRFPIIVVPGVRQYVCLSMTVGRDPAFPGTALKKSVKEALGVAGEEGDGVDGSNGLFSIRNRAFGRPEYATRIEGTVQNLEGVVWVRVDALDLVKGDDPDPTALEAPNNPVRKEAVLCGCEESKEAAHIVVCLHTAHFYLNLSETDATEVTPDG